MRSRTCFGHYEYAGSQAGRGPVAERDLGHVAALLEVLDPALDLLDLPAHGGELALYQKRVLHVVGPVLYRFGSVCSAASRFRSRDCKSTYSSVTSCPETVSVVTSSPRPLSSSRASSKCSEGTERMRSAYTELSER